LIMNIAFLIHSIVSQTSTTIEAITTTSTTLAVAATPLPTPAITAVQGTGTLEDLLLSISMQSASAILYILFGLSILSLAIFFEKLIQYTRENSLPDDFKARLVKFVDAGDLGGAKAMVEGKRGIKAAIIREGLGNFNEGPLVMEELINGRAMLEKNRLDKRLIILGTIGNNAPFIGLLGTVMGIIRAFNDLSQATTQGPQTVMSGISEALIATAVGLFVAIPAVVFYNYFKARQKGIVDGAFATAGVLMAFAKRKHVDEAKESK